MKLTRTYLKQLVKECINEAQSNITSFINKVKISNFGTDAVKEKAKLTKALVRLSNVGEIASIEGTITGDGYKEEDAFVVTGSSEKLKITMKNDDKLVWDLSTWDGPAGADFEYTCNGKDIRFISQAPHPRLEKDLADGYEKHLNKKPIKRTGPFGGNWQPGDSHPYRD